MEEILTTGCDLCLCFMFKQEFINQEAKSKSEANVIMVEEVFSHTQVETNGYQLKILMIKNCCCLLTIVVSA